MDTFHRGRRLDQDSFPHMPWHIHLCFQSTRLLTGMKTTVSEAEHPLLCEGTRREKGDLALALMITYKDDQAKLKKVRG